MALALFVVWASDEAGYPVTHWAPGGLVLLALLVIALSSVRLRPREVPVAVRIALGCLALYTALSFLSILWADVPADAWEGANRTLLYLIVFALFALWPLRGRSAALLLVAWTLAMIGLAAFVLLRVDAHASLAWFADEGRLGYPANYENASAATWAMAMWPALLLVSERSIPWTLRGLLAGGTVLLADLALLSQSRGSLYATPVMLILLFVLLPGRLRRLVLLAPIAVGIGLTVPAILRVGDRVRDGGDAHAALHTATEATLAAAVVVGIAIALGAVLERRRLLSGTSLRRARKGVGVLVLVLAVVVLVGGWVAAGNPVGRVRHAWDTFKSGQGYAANGTGNRLTSGLGSDRYDFYRVALDEFVAHPLVGIGVDNFQQQYLRHGRGGETPRYPHSVELRTLAETGLVGALLAIVGLGAALLAGGRAVLRRRADPLASAIAAAALAGFVYWVVHGSFDWLWEFAGLGAPAFALLGLACGLAPRRDRSQASEHRDRREAQAIPRGDGRGALPFRDLRGARPLAILAACTVGLVIVASLTAPWLSQLQIESAAHIWTRSPGEAYARLNGAARLNPLSDEPYLVAGSIALRFGDLKRAEHEFGLALKRTSGDAYATLELGAIASANGESANALALLRRATYLDPRDPLTHEALDVVRKNERVSIEALNRSILLQARKLV